MTGSAPVSSPVSIEGRNFLPLFPDLLRPLTTDEREQLRSDIREAGRVEVAVVIDEADGIIDGLNRLGVAAEEGLSLDKIRFDVRQDLSLEDKRRLALRLNVVRRHLKPEDRAALAVQFRQQGQSLRQIAEQLGTSKDTVQRDLAAGVSFETPDSPTKVTGMDGKKYAAQGKRRQQPTELPKIVTDPPDEAIDQEGQAIPSRLRDVFAEGILQYAARQLKSLLPAIQDATRWAVYLDPLAIKGKREPTTAELMEVIISRLEAAVPYAVDPHCRGKGCDQCRASGYLTDWKVEDLKMNGGWPGFGQEDGYSGCGPSLK